MFSGTIWSLLTHDELPFLFLEIRDEHQKKVSFAGIDLSSNTMLFDKLVFEENWWIKLSEVSGNILLFTIYTDTNNPDKKSLIAYNFKENKILWWRNNYAVSAVIGDKVMGSETGLGMKLLILSLQDGQPHPDQSLVMPPQNPLIHKPQQYFAETPHFNTVKSFLNIKLGVVPVNLIEYLEFEQVLVMSFYKDENGLANYLMIANNDGEVLYNERIGEQLKGIGADTFFLFSGYLIFAKNKRELVSLKMV